MDKATVRSVRETSRLLFFWKGGFTDGDHTAHAPAYRQGTDGGNGNRRHSGLCKEPAKQTDNGRLITGWQCDSRVADAEFLLSKRQYAALTGRTRGEDDVIAYHVRQSFVPGEITPRRKPTASAWSLQSGSPRAIMPSLSALTSTRAHIHNHIIWNSTALDCKRKFRNFWAAPGPCVGSLTPSVVENGLSIVGEPEASWKDLQQVAGRCRQAPASGSFTHGH